MINQIDSEIYNVNYKKQDYTTGNWDFEVEYEKEDNRWKIQVSNITYNGEVYDGKINNWKIEYRNNDEDYWKNANGKKFYVTKSGNYYIRISFEEINIGPKLISILNDENIEEDI